MVLSKRSHEGYLMVDHRGSPGIPPEIARKLGYEPEQVAEGQLFEAPTLGCAHCGTVVIMNPNRVRERAWCFKCDQYICDNCEYLKQQSNYVHTSIKELKYG